MKKFRGITRSDGFKLALIVIGAAFVIRLITRLTPHTAGVSLKITVDCANVGELWCDFSLGGKELGSMSAGVMENDALVSFERGEVASMNIPAEAFNSAERLCEEEFGFTLTVFDSDGERHPVRCEGAEFTAELGGKYSYTLTRENGEYICV